MASASAPGKVILFGEHAVVYGRPAIAAPVFQVQATASLEVAPPGSGLTLVAPDLDRSVRLDEATSNDPLGTIVRLTLAQLDLPVPDGVLTVVSTIPIAGGMGSGAAVSAAIVRALAASAGVDIPPSEVNALVFEVEKLYHGTPSGIDNTVVVYGQPTYFVRGQSPHPFSVGAPLRLLIADSGIPSPTRKVVEEVRKRWRSEPVHYDFLFDRIGELVDEAREAIEQGDLDTLGRLMDQNHSLLQEMGVSSPKLDELVEEARMAGALGAKLSGAGCGGNVIVLVEEAEEMRETLEKAGAARVISTTV